MAQWRFCWTVRGRLMKSEPKSEEHALADLAMCLRRDKHLDPYLEEVPPAEPPKRKTNKRVRKARVA